MFFSMIKPLSMQILPIAYESPIELPKLVKVDGRKKPVLKRFVKVRPFYPRVLMPVQPERYLRQKENDCW